MKRSGFFSAFTLVFFSSVVCGATPIQPGIYAVSSYNNSVDFQVKNTSGRKSYIKMMAAKLTCESSKNPLACKKEKYEEKAPIINNVRFSSSKFILNPGQVKVVKLRFVGNLPKKPIVLGVWGEDFSQHAVKTAASQVKLAKIAYRIKVRYLSKVLIIPEGVFISPVIEKNSDKVLLQNKAKIPMAFSGYVICADKGGPCEQQRFKKFLPAKKTYMLQMKKGQRLSVRYYDYKKQKWVRSIV